MMNYDIILSFTSWKGRIYDPSFLFVLLSMLTQKTTYKYKVILVLSTDEFKNKEKDLPPKIVELNELCDWFEILWTKENTKAYKKYFPTRRAYPSENICALDDDSPLHSDFVQRFCKLLKENPGKMIIGTNHFQGNTSNTIRCVRFGAACFRPDSLYDLDEQFGRTYFLDHDDEYLALLSVLAGAHSVRVDIHRYIQVDRFQQNHRLATIGQLRYNNLRSLWDKCFREHPELRELYNKNKNLKN